MPSSLKIGFVATALALAFLAFYFGLGGAEKRIQRRLDELVGTIEKSDQEGKLAGLAAARKASLFFTEYCRVQHPYGSSDVSGREGVTGLVASLRTYAREISVNIRKQDLSLASDERSATMELWATARVEFADTKEKADQQFLIDWVEIEREWLIERGTVVAQPE